MSIVSRHSFQGFFFWMSLFMAIASITRTTRAGDPARTTVKIVTNGKTVLGRPLAINKYEIIMLRRDGRMLDYDSSEIQSAEQVSSVFTPYSSLAMQQHLQKLFGKQYEVTRTAHYVVVHPPGKRRQWAEPFEDLYGRFTHYFSVRGYSLRSAEFPLVVVVFNSRSEFNQVAGKDGLSNPNAYAGYYSPTSNWIVTVNDPNTDAGNSTLIHESLHQFAYNTGIHQRWAATPKWCAEGLATMFESRGVNDSHSHSAARDRVDAYYLGVLKQRLGKEPPAGLLEALVSGDGIFDQDIQLAYGLAWGLTWYLAETRQAQLNTYLQKIAQRPRLEPYSANDRIADFRDSFGIDFVMLQSHFVQYLHDPRWQ
jgi:hypothetical protein